MMNRYEPWDGTWIFPIGEETNSGDMYVQCGVCGIPGCINATGGGKVRSASHRKKEHRAAEELAARRAARAYQIEVLKCEIIERRILDPAFDARWREAEARFWAAGDDEVVAG